MEWTFVERHQTQHTVDNVFIETTELLCRDAQHTCVYARHAVYPTREHTTSHVCFFRNVRFCACRRCSVESTDAVRVGVGTTASTNTTMVVGGPIDILLLAFVSVVYDARTFVAEVRGCVAASSNIVESTRPTHLHSVSRFPGACSVVQARYGFSSGSAMTLAPSTSFIIRVSPNRSP